MPLATPLLRAGLAALVLLAASPALAQGLLQITPQSGLAATLEAGTTAEATLTLTNAGDAPLDFRVPLFAEDGRSTRAFGYLWADSDSPDGPAFEGIDIRDTGTPLTLVPAPGCGFPVVDDGGTWVTLPFAFPYDGAVYTEVFVSANGHLTVVAPTQCTFVGLSAGIPSPRQPNGLIAPFWDDLFANGPSRLLTETLADGRFVVQWTDWGRFGHATTAGLTFQAILAPSGAITFQYLSAGFDLRVVGRVGLESADGLAGVLVATGPGYVRDSLAVRFTPTGGLVSGVTPAAGTLAPGASAELTVTLSAEGLVAGVYENGLIVEGGGATRVVPVTLLVTGTPRLEIAPDTLAFEPTVVGAERLRWARVGNAGTAPTSVAGVSVSDLAFGVVFGGPIQFPLVLAPGASVPFQVLYTPTAPGEDLGTVTLTTDAGATATAVLSGLGLAPPQAQLTPPSLVFAMTPDGPTGSANLSLSNVADVGAAPLTYTAFTRPGTSGDPRVSSTGSPLLTARASDGVFLTQSLGQEITQGLAQTCPAGGRTSLWRAYNLAEAGIADDLTITSVEFALALAEPSTSTVRIYQLDGDLRFGTRTLLAEAAVVFDTTAAPQMVRVPFQQVTIPAGGAFAIEWDAFVDGEAGPFFGFNDAGQTRPYYVSCSTFAGLPPTPQPANTAWIANVRGFAGPPAFAVAPDSGSVAPGEVATLTVSVDATSMPAGSHPYEVVVLTNDPAQPVFVVPVTIDVEANVVSTGDAAGPLALALAPVFPNPFAGTSTVAFTLPEPGAVRVEVLDLMGRRVAVLVDDEVSAGRHEARWSAAGLAAGSYVVRLTTPAETLVRRAVVAR